jgi:hypothetical protein
MARCPSCSQSPHDETVVARCAQQKGNLATPLERCRELECALLGYLHVLASQWVGG